MNLQSPSPCHLRQVEEIHRRCTSCATRATQACIGRCTADVGGLCVVCVSAKGTVADLATFAIERSRRGRVRDAPVDGGCRAWRANSLVCSLAYRAVELAWTVGRNDTRDLRRIRAAKAGWAAQAEQQSCPKSRTSTTHSPDNGRIH